MINLFNKLLKRFNLQVVPKQEEEPQQEYSLVEETVKFMNENPKYFDGDQYLYSITSGYVGDINFIKGKNGKTYYQDMRSEKYFCDYDMRNPSKEVLKQMIDETTFTKEQLDEELK